MRYTQVLKMENGHLIHKHNNEVKEYIELKEAEDKVFRGEVLNADKLVDKLWDSHTTKLKQRQHIQDQIHRHYQQFNNAPNPTIDPPLDPTAALYPSQKLDCEYIDCDEDAIDDVADDCDPIGIHSMRILLPQ